MELNRDTKLADLLKEYPWLRDEAAKLSDKAKMIDSPIGRILLKKATIADISSRTGIPEDEIIRKIGELIEAHEQAGI